MNRLLLLIGFLSSLPIVSHAQLTASFVVSDSVGCAPALVVNFTNTSTGGSIASCDWTFLQGGNVIGASTVCTPSFIFTQAGVYTVCLTVTDFGGVSDTQCETDLIVVNAPPQVGLTIDEPLGCIGYCPTFTSNLIAGGAPLCNCTWSFGDGSVVTNNCVPVSHCYNQAGIFNVTLVAEDCNGCTNTVSVQNAVQVIALPTADFSTPDTSNCTPPFTSFFINNSTGNAPGAVLTYEWNFGDPATLLDISNLENPNYTYTNFGSFSVTLITTNTNAAGCSDTFTISPAVTIQDITASFTVSNASACEGANITFTNTTPGATTFAWDFGDGQTSALANPTHAYSVAGNYDVTLIASNGACFDTVIFSSIVINPSPTADFIGDVLQSCTTPHVVNYTDLSAGGVVSWNWSFSGGTPPTSNLQNPSITYNNAGLFQTRLIVTNANGCRDTLVRPGYIQIQPVTVNISADVNQGCAPLTVVFDDNSTAIGSQITSWSWNFGDPPSGAANTSTLQNPTHIFGAVGTYDITLTVTTNTGCTGTQVFNDFITLSDAPVANFFADPTDTCINTEVFFFDTSTGTIDEWIWDVGEATYTQPNPSHVYNNDTVCYDIQLVVGNLGCYDTLTLLEYVCIDPPLAEFDYLVTCANPFFAQFFDLSSSDVDVWEWDFGDGSPISNQQSPSHTYAATGDYTVELTTFNLTTGCDDRYVQIVQIRDPVPQFSITGSTGCSPFVVTVNNTSVDASVYTWTSPGASISNPAALNPTFTYNNPGVNQVSITLTITDDNLCQETITIDTSVVISGAVADFNYTPNIGCAPLNVTFTDASTPVFGTLNSWTWDFGDNTPPVIGQSVNHVYTSAGSFNATLTVTTDQGCSDTISYLVQPSFPNVNLSASDLSVCPGEVITFNSIANGLTPFTYVWDFGDGSPINNSPIAQHAYAQGGVYTVSLTVTDANGCDSTRVRTNFITVSSVTADFTQDNTSSSCPPLIVNYTNLSTAATTYNWVLESPSGTNIVSGVSNSINPSYIYTEPGFYDVSLIAIDANGCRDTLRIDSLISIGGPQGFFSVTPDSGCVPLCATFTLNTLYTQSATAYYQDGAFPEVLALTPPTPGGGSTTTFTHCYLTDNGIGFYPYILLEDTAGCPNVIEAQDTIFTDSLSISFTQDQSILCSPGDIAFNSTLNGSAPLTINWAFQGGNPSVSNAPDPSINYSVPGIYDVTLIVSNTYCRDTISKPDTVILGTDPINAFQTSLPNPCQPNIVSFINNSTLAFGLVQTWIWDFGDGASQSNDQNPVHTFPVSAPGTPVDYNVTMVSISEYGCIDTIIQPVTIYPPLIPTISADTFICANGQAQLVAGGGNSYQWFPSLGLNQNNIPNPIASPGASTTYNVIISDIPGCQILESVQVDVSTAIAAAGSDAEICEGDLTQLNGTTNGNNIFAWSPALGLSDSTIANPVANPTVTTTYTLTVSDSLGCSSSDNVTVEVNPLPILNLTNDTTICRRDVTQIVVTPFSPSPPFTYVWDPTTNLSCGTCGNPFATPQSTTLYTVTVTDDEGCTATAQSLITVTQIPNYNLTQDDTICPGASLQLFAENAIDYFWLPAAGLSDPNIGNPIATPAQSTMYTVDLTFANGCDTRDTVFVGVYDLSAVNAGPDTAVCIGESYQINVGQGGTILWTPSTYLSDSASFNPIATPDTATLYVMQVDTVGCTIIDSLFINVYLRTPLVVEDASVCFGDSVQLFASGGTIYEWQPPFYLNDATSPTPVSSPPSTTVYTVYAARQPFCPTTFDTVTVTVIPEVVFDILAPFGRVYEPGEALQLEVPGVGPGYTYEWSPALGLTCTDCPNPLAAPDTSAITYTVIVTDSFGCTSQQSIDLRRLNDCDELIVIPNAFTPNGDGLNDVLFVRGASTVSIYRIFNRWGELVFESNSPAIGWDGLHDGKAANAGVYMYYVEAPCPLTGQSVMKKGDVTLIR